MSKPRRLALLATLLCFSALSMPGAAGAAGFDQFIVFGDSTLDTGYFRYSTTGNSTSDAQLVNAINQGATGGWAGNGVMNSIILAEKFGLTAAPVDAPGGGTNYANGGATTIFNPAGGAFPDNVCTLQEIENYLGAVNGVANPKALYLIKTGDNDVTYYDMQSQNPAWLAANPNYLNGIASALAVEVATLQAAGARTIVVRNSYDSALFAQQGGDINPIYNTAYANSKTMWTSEWADLTAAGVHFIPDDNDSLFRFVAHNPQLFGFTPLTVMSPNAPITTLTSWPFGHPHPRPRAGIPVYRRRPPDHGGPDHRVGLHLQPAHRAQRDVPLGRKRRAGRLDPRRHDPRSDRSVRATAPGPAASTAGPAPGPTTPKSATRQGWPATTAPPSAARWVSITRPPEGLSWARQ